MIDLLRRRLEKYSATNAVQEEQALKETLQAGPWKDQNTVVSAEWLGDTMTSKIKTINWPLAAQDVAPFLPAAEQLSLSLWSERFFADKVSKLVQAALVDDE